MSLIRAIVKSFWGTLFIAVVSTGVLGCLAIPWVGQQFGPVVCEPGEEMVYETYSWSNGSESGTNVEYYCESRNGRREVAFWQLLAAGAAAWYGLVFVVVWPLATARSFVKNRNETRLREEGVEMPARIVSVSQTNVRLNNRPLLSIVFEIQPPTRGAYQITKRTTVPDILLAHVQPGKRLMVTVDPHDEENVLISWEKLAVGSTVEGGGGGSPHGRVERLEALKEMRDKGLISREEYETKKDEILDEL